VSRLLRSSAVAEEIYVGNAATDAAARGWLLGHFMPPGDPRRSDDVEIKRGVHPDGERRPGWVTDDPRSMLSVLVSGRFRREHQAEFLSSLTRWRFDEKSDIRRVTR
jgi:hypothetical protein